MRFKKKMKEWKFLPTRIGEITVTNREEKKGSSYTGIFMT